MTKIVLRFASVLLEMATMFFSVCDTFVGDDVTVTIFLMDDIRRLLVVAVDDGVVVVGGDVVNEVDSIFTTAPLVLAVVVVIVGAFACFLSLTGWKLDKNKHGKHDEDYIVRILYVLIPGVRSIRAM